MSSKPVVRAIDIGYGNTKFVASERNHGDISEVVCRSIPSIAPKASHLGDLGAGMMARRETIRVSVRDVMYEVGPDAELAQGGIARDRHLMTDYCKSDQYEALMKGALFYMDVEKIDLLTLGLPVSTYAKYKDEVMARAVGTHDCGSSKVTVRHARVYPQPLGGFFYHAAKTKLFEQMRASINLLIDPGFYTLDWLMTSGMKTIDARSGAANDGGMGSILKSVMAAIASDFKVDESEIGDFSRVDAALRGEGTLTLFGKAVDMGKYTALANAKAEEALTQLAQSVGRQADIANIVLVGGGSGYYKTLIAKMFPRHQISVAHEPLFANVRGFQIIGEQRAKLILDEEVLNQRKVALIA